MASVDQYFGFNYDRTKFNCLHFAKLVWANETGAKIEDEIFNFDRWNKNKVSNKFARKFVKLKKPVSPCIAIFKGRIETHIGIFIRGKILHLTENGVQFQPVDVVSMTFFKVRFYQYE